MTACHNKSRYQPAIHYFELVLRYDEVRASLADGRLDPFQRTQSRIPSTPNPERLIVELRVELLHFWCTGMQFERHSRVCEEQALCWNQIQMKQTAAPRLEMLILCLSMFETNKREVDG